jgi:hypothetical protein
MKKNTKVILLFFSTIFSLLIIFMTYYSLDRYAGLHLSKINKYIENYSKLDKIKGRTVISFYTTPDRIKKINPMIKSILDQTVKVDEIALNLPPSKEKYNIPPEYEQIINVYNVGKNYGTSTSIIPTLLREKEKGTKIIYLDDDKIYGKDFIQTMLEEGEKIPDRAVVCKKNEKICGVLVKPEFFKTDVVYNKMENFDNNWMMDHLTNKSREINYKENYKIIF